MVQWIVSERRGESVIPLAFWYLSLLGSILIFVYAIRKADPVFMLASVLQCVIYVRNLMLIYRRRGRLGCGPACRRTLERGGRRSTGEGGGVNRAKGETGDGPGRRL